MDPVAPVKRNSAHPIIYWRTAAFVLSVLILVGVIFYVWDRDNISQKSIRTACVLQNNQIIQSQSGRPAYLILVREVLRNADQDGRPYVRLNFDKKSEKLMEINLADCDDVSEHPEALRVEQLPTDPEGRVNATGEGG